MGTAWLGLHTLHMNGCNQSDWHYDISPSSYKLQVLCSLTEASCLLRSSIS